MKHPEQNRERLRRLCEEVKSHLDYEAFYQSFCQDARISGTHLHAHCPVPAHRHSGQGNPSLSVDLRRGLFHCFSRDEGGDAVRFYELMHNVSFSQAINELAQRTGTDGVEHTERLLVGRALLDKANADTTHGEHFFDQRRMSAVCERFLAVCRCEDQTEGVNYLTRRGINMQTIANHAITYFPRRAYRRVMHRMLSHFAADELQQSGLFNHEARLTFYSHRLLFPFRIEGRAVYLQARTTASGVEPRWHNMRGSVPTLYNADSLDALRSGTVVYVVEGFTDTLTLLSHGFAAVGLVGAGGFKEEWLAPLARFRTVAALDGDQAGARGLTRLAELFQARGIPLASLTLSSDVNDFFRRRPTAPLEWQLLTEDALEAIECGEARQSST